MTARMMHLNLFVFGCGHHRGAWRHPQSSVERLGDIRYYEHLAQTAERGKLDAVFFADGHAVGNVADGSAWFLEPLTALAAISRATERIGLISTVSSTFATPFHTARQLASLDHISGGRMGWNVVTSMFDAEARNHGYAAMPAHAERYRRAEEFVAAVLKLWDSWTDDALQWDRGGQYADPAEGAADSPPGRVFSGGWPPQCAPAAAGAPGVVPGRRLGAGPGPGGPPGRGHLCRGLGLACRPGLLPGYQTPGAGGRAQRTGAHSAGPGPLCGCDRRTRRKPNSGNWTAYYRWRPRCVSWGCLRRRTA